MQGVYLGGVWFPDKTRVGWWKNGYPKYFGKMINAVPTHKAPINNTIPAKTNILT